MDKVLVTGAFGLIGNAVRVALEARGTAVVPTDLGSATEEGRQLVPFDVRDAHRLHAIIDDRKINAIIHCGAVSGPMLARDNPAAIVSINTMGTLNILEAARIHRLRRVVLFSSVSAFGDTPDGMSPVPENILLRPNTVYGASKAAAEALMGGYVAEHGAPVIALRPGWVYGPRRTTDCDIREMLLGGLRGKPVRLAAAAAASRQFVHVDDVARAAVLALDAETAGGEAYTIDGAETVPLATVAEIIRKIVPNFDVSFAGTAVEDRQAPFDLSAAARGLGFRPEVNLMAGISAYADWLKARL